MLTIEPGTTPEITVEMPVDVDTLASVYVTFVQGGTTVIEKKPAAADIRR